MGTSKQTLPPPLLHLRRALKLNFGTNGGGRPATGSCEGGAWGAEPSPFCCDRAEELDALSLMGDLGPSGFVGEVGVAAMTSVVIGVSSESDAFVARRRERRTEFRGMV